MDINSYLLFVAASIVLCIAPGPDMVYLLTRSIAQGKRAGLLAALGINLGAYVHLFAAILGLTAILATSSFAFALVKMLGAIYLIYIGIKFLTSKRRPLDIRSERKKHIKGSEIFWQGFISDVLNPKVALFYLAFLPQFVDAGSENFTSQLVLLGVTLNIIGITTNVLMVYVSTAITKGLRKNSLVSNVLNKVMGAVFVSLGIRLATEKA